MLVCVFWAIRYPGRQFASTLGALSFPYSAIKPFLFINMSPFFIDTHFSPSLVSCSLEHSLATVAHQTILLRSCQCKCLTRLH